MKIIDTFLFFNELDILDIRLNELYDKVDRFILCESKYTFAGREKSLIFEENKLRYSKFLDKITHIILDQNYPNYSAENREFYNRSAISLGLKNIDADIIMLSDVDEIPKVEYLNRDIDISVFRQDMYYFNFNTKFLQPEDHLNWHGSIAFNAKYLDINLGWLRNQRYNISNIIKDGGWHFSYFNTTNNIIQKIINGGHTDLHNIGINEDIIKYRINNYIDVFDRPGYLLEHILDNQNLPKYILQNKKKYSHLFKDKLYE